MSEPRGNGLRIPLLVDSTIILAGLVYGVLMWARVEQLREDRRYSVSGERIAALESALKAASEDRYRSRDAERDFAYRDYQIMQNQKELERLQERLSRLERRTRE